jgi:hypothetical protein
VPIKRSLIYQPGKPARPGAEKPQHLPRPRRQIFRQHPAPPVQACGPRLHPHRHTSRFA